MKYSGQAPSLSDEEIITYLKKERRARVCTHNQDGTIHAVPVAYRYLDCKIIFLSFISSKKTRNIRRNSQITLLVDTTEPFKGVIVYGRGEISDMDPYDGGKLILEFAPFDAEKKEKYLKSYLEVTNNYIIEVTPERYVSFDYGKDEIYKNQVEKHLFD